MSDASQFGRLESFSQFGSNSTELDGIPQENRLITYSIRLGVRQVSICTYLMLFSCNICAYTHVHKHTFTHTDIHAENLNVAYLI